MLDVDGNIKLIDFGCAKRLKKNQNTHSMRQILRSMRGMSRDHHRLLKTSMVPFIQVLPIGWHLKWLPRRAMVKKRISGLLDVHSVKWPPESHHGHRRIIIWQCCSSLVGSKDFQSISIVSFFSVNGTKPPADLPATCTAAAQEFFRLCLTRDAAVRPSAKNLLVHPFLSSWIRWYLSIFCPSRSIVLFQSSSSFLPGITCIVLYILFFFSLAFFLLRVDD